MLLSKALRIAEVYEKQAFISTPAQATIKLKDVLKGLLGDEIYKEALEGKYDANLSLTIPFEERLSDR